MKKTVISLLMAGLSAAMLLTSCNVEDEFTRADKVSGEQVFFPSNAPTSFTLDATSTSVSIPVRRSGGNEAEYTVSLLADYGSMTEEDKLLFTVPVSVTFPAGETDVEVEVGVDVSGIVPGEEYELGLLLNDPDNTTPYGTSTLYFTMAFNSWISLGEATYREDFVTTFFSAPCVEYKVEIQENEAIENVFRLVNPYGAAYPYNEPGDYDTENDHYMVINASNPTAVYIETFNSGMNWGYGDFTMSSISYYYLARGDAEQAASYYGTYDADAGLITFPSGALLCGMADYQNGGLFNANTHGKFAVALPGFSLGDYSLTASYGGTRVSSNGQTAYAVVDFTCGPDVAGVMYTVVSGDITGTDYEVAYLEALVEGTLDEDAVYVVEDFVQGAESVSVEVELTVGNYTVIAVPLDADEAPLESDASSVAFYFPAGQGTIATLSLYPVSEYAPAADYAESYPDYYSFAYEITTATGLTSLTYLVWPTADVEYYGEYGYSPKDIVTVLGTSATEEELSELNTSGSIWSIIPALNEETSYTMIVAVTNAYGTAVLSEEITTAEIPYNGELAIGSYTMTYQPEGADGAYESTFDVLATPNSDTEFYVRNLGVVNEASWEAVYDPTAGTLTLSGIERGYEDYGNQFGSAYSYFDNEGTQYYGICSYASSSSTGSDPVVFAVDPATKQLSALNTTLTVAVWSAEDFSLVGYYNYFPAGESTEIVYNEAVEDSGEATTAAKSLYARPAINKAESAIGPQSNAGELVKTTARRCEPLAKEPVRTFRAPSTVAVR